MLLFVLILPYLFILISVSIIVDKANIQNEYLPIRTSEGAEESLHSVLCRIFPHFPNIFQFLRPPLFCFTLRNASHGNKRINYFLRLNSIDRRSNEIWGRSKTFFSRPCPPFFSTHNVPGRLRGGRGLSVRCPLWLLRGREGQRRDGPADGVPNMPHSLMLHNAVSIQLLNGAHPPGRWLTVF